VGGTVDFDHQSRCDTDEVGDVAAQDVLSAELQAPKPSGSEHPPHAGFRRGFLLPELASATGQEWVSGHRVDHRRRLVPEQRPLQAFPVDKPSLRALTLALSPKGRGSIERATETKPGFQASYDEGVLHDLVVMRRRSGELDFDSLVGPHLDAGYRTALAILRNPDEAHDAVQEAAFKAWRRMRQLHEAGSARSWFLAIVANQCKSVRRTRWWSGCSPGFGWPRRCHA
jgi:hypothetical protein